MNKYFLSLGLAVAGTSSLHAAYAPDIGPDAARMWSASATLRGFYDNNYTTGNTKAGSAGFEFSPEIKLNVPLQQTEFGLRYIYGLYYYQARQNLDQKPIDQSQQVDLWLDHAFTERWSMRAEDSMIYSQEPQLNGINSLPFRTSDNNLYNTATISLRTDWSRLFSTVLGYQNTLNIYQNTGGTATAPSYAGLLNRVGNTAWLDLQFQVKPETMLLVGGSITALNYTGDEPIAPGVPNDVMSDSRNANSYIGYVGGQHQFLPDLSLYAKVGVQYSDYYNDPQGATEVNPWGKITLTYNYLPGDYAELGFIQAQNATDEVSPTTNGGITLSQISSLIYGKLTHELTPKLTGTLIGTGQFSTYNGGTYNNDTDKLFSMGANLSYAFNRHFSAEVGDSFDELTSDIPGRGYNRNRVYAGVTATY